MKTYKVNIEHKRYGLNWSSKRVEAKSFEEALQKGKKALRPTEKIEDIRLLRLAE